MCRMRLQAASAINIINTAKTVGGGTKWLNQAVLTREAVKAKNKSKSNAFGGNNMEEEMKRKSCIMRKGTALLLASALVLGLTPALPGISTKARADEATAPSVTAYATRDQLMDSFNPGSGTLGKLYLGKNKSGSKQAWFILGEDTGVSGKNTAIFAASPMTTGLFNENYDGSTNYPYWDGSQVYWNHYGVSTLRTTLENMLAGNFKQSERDIMQATTVSTDDIKNAKNFTTSDVLYAASGTYNASNISVGSSNNKTLPAATYWPSATGSWFWLRSPVSSALRTTLTRLTPIRVRAMSTSALCTILPVLCVPLQI